MTLVTTKKFDVLDSSEERITKEEIQLEVKRVSSEIEVSIGNTNPVLLGIMNGALRFCAALIDGLPFKLEYDSFHISRYRGGMAGGDIKYLNYPKVSVKGRTVLVIDDILDQGKTLEAATQWAKKNGASNVLTAVLINKKINNSGRRIKPDFCCFEIQDEFIFGFGMDIDGYWRNLDSIYAITNPAKFLP